MTERRHEYDGGICDKCLENAVVPAGDDAKQQPGKEDGGDGDGDHLPLVLSREELAAVVGERRG